VLLNPIWVGVLLADAVTSDFRLAPGKECRALVSRSLKGTSFCKRAVSRRTSVPQPRYWRLSISACVLAMISASARRIGRPASRPAGARPMPCAATKRSTCGRSNGTEGVGSRRCRGRFPKPAEGSASVERGARGQWEAAGEAPPRMTAHPRLGWAVRKLALVLAVIFFAGALGAVLASVGYALLGLDLLW